VVCNDGDWVSIFWKISAPRNGDGMGRDNKSSNNLERGVQTHVAFLKESTH
jgi:hypothetical protein